MTTHYMNLQARYFNFIKQGTKWIELRLNDPKRQQIKLNDLIEFSDENRKLLVKVVGIMHYNSFVDLFEDFTIEKLADNSMTKDELLSVLQDFYPISKQHQFGVIGIKIELV